MSIFNILALSIALAMDAFAVAVAVGISLKRVSLRQTFRLSWHFGFFQAFMPVLGWMMGIRMYSLIEDYDHWAAFMLLSFVGGKMLLDALKGHKEGTDAGKDPTKAMSLVMLSVATSIDALVIGFSISMLDVSIVFPVIVIGLVAILFTVIGLFLGTKLGSSSKLSIYAEIIGGVVLLCIGVNILFEHGVLVY